MGAAVAQAWRRDLRTSHSAISSRGRAQLSRQKIAGTGLTPRFRFGEFRRSAGGRDGGEWRSLRAHLCQSEHLDRYVRRRPFESRPAGRSSPRRRQVRRARRVSSFAYDGPMFIRPIPVAVGASWIAMGSCSRMYPERIVCLTEETTETLYLLGEGHRVVGISGYTLRPIEARCKPKVSSFISARYEKIEALEPDLILTFSDLQAGIALELVKRGLPVLASTSGRSQRSSNDSGSPASSAARRGQALERVGRPAR